jgi:hypothetical protein
MVSSNAPWLDDVFLYNSPTPSQSGGPHSSTTTTPSGPRIWTPTTLSLARCTYKKLDMALRRRVTSVFPSPGVATTRFTTNTAATAYTHTPYVSEGDLIFSLPDTAIGLLYRSISPTKMQYIGWALTEQALNELDPFWVSDVGIEESMKFLNRMGKYHELEVKASGDMLFLMACSPRGWWEVEEQKSKGGRGRVGMWWGKGMPVSMGRGEDGGVGDLGKVEFKEPDKAFERRQRSLKY